MHYCKFGLTDNENPPIPCDHKNICSLKNYFSLLAFRIFILALHTHVNEEAIKNLPLKFKQMNEAIPTQCYIDIYTQ